MGGRGSEPDSAKIHTTTKKGRGGRAAIPVSYTASMVKKSSSSNISVRFSSHITVNKKGGGDPLQFGE